MQETTTVPQGAASLHRHVPGDLLHPRLVRVNSDSGDVHPAALKMDEKQHVVGHQPAQRQHLRREEVARHPIAIVEYLISIRGANQAEGRRVALLVKHQQTSHRRRAA
jgi:hypothetical protein